MQGGISTFLEFNEFPHTQASSSAEVIARLMGAAMRAVGDFSTLIANAIDLNEEPATYELGRDLVLDRIDCAKACDNTVVGHSDAVTHLAKALEIAEIYFKLVLACGEPVIEGEGVARGAIEDVRKVIEAEGDFISFAC